MYGACAYLRMCSHCLIAVALEICALPFVEVSLPECKRSEIMPAYEGSMSLSIMRAWGSSQAAIGASPRAAFSLVHRLCPVRCALGATNLAMAARMPWSWAAFLLCIPWAVPAHVLSR